ncbi:MAG: hypothetical protein U0263_17000 [Polyangiaceae bacterium]
MASEKPLQRSSELPIIVDDQNLPRPGCHAASSAGLSGGLPSFPLFRDLTCDALD